jgi:hypothetical protein
MFIRPEMPLTHQDYGVSMGGSLKEVSIVKNYYILTDPKGRLNSYPIFYIHVEPYIVGKLGHISQLLTMYYCNLSCTERVIFF